MAATKLVDAIPFAKDAYGGYRVGARALRWTLWFARSIATAEEVVQRYSSRVAPIGETHLNLPRYAWDYSELNNCGASPGAGLHASVHIGDNGGTSPRSVALTGMRS